MKSDLPSHYSEAVNFTLETPTGVSREFYSLSLYLYARRETAFKGQIYLKAFEKVTGGVAFLQRWAPVTRAGILEFFTTLASHDTEAISSRPFRLGQNCDGTISAPVFHAFKTACDALGLDASDLYRKAYPDPEERGDLPDWSDCQRHSEWQGGVKWPERWDAAAVAGLAYSLAEICEYDLRDEFEAVAMDALLVQAIEAKQGGTRHE